ncbi:MAG: hypothetical protein HGB12_03975 [Bacteroidetes bacterium]|nr:hypothetical protein [Bacteroidota bacterium]
MKPLYINIKRGIGKDTECYIQKAKFRGSNSDKCGLFLQTLLTSLIVVLAFHFHAQSQQPSHLNINTGNNIILSNNVVLSLSGNLINNGSLITKDTLNDTDTLKFEGSSLQEILGTGINKFQNVKIKNSGGSTEGVQLSNTVNTVHVDGSLCLISGPLKLNGKKIIIDNPATTAITRNDGSVTGTGYIVSESTDSIIQGLIQWNIGSTTGAHVFPFGTVSGSYIPVTFENTGNVGNLSASTRPTGADNRPLAPGITSMTGGTGGTINATTAVIDRWWDFNSSLGSTLPPVNLVLTYEGTDNSFSSYSGTFGFQHWAGTYWNDGKGGPAGSICNTTISGGATPGATYSISAEGLTQFSDYILVKSDMPLPIELLGFTTSCNNEIVQVEWSTASETNNDYFTLEKSYDLINWTTVAIIDGMGNSNTITNYIYTDTLSLSNGKVIDVKYYRLKQTDFDGIFTYSDVIHTNCSDVPFEIIRSYPNPADDYINCDIISYVNTSLNISFIDALGRNVINAKANITKGKNHLLIDVSKLVPAAYYFSIKTSDGLYKYSENILIR